MTTVPFGDAKEYATVMFDRQTQVCVVVANSLKYIPDALAIVRSLNAEHVSVIAPIGTNRHFEELALSEELEVFNAK